MMQNVVIAAAGKGTRMLDLAKDRPKHIIPVAGQPFLFYLLSNLKTAGFEDIYLVAGYQKDKIADFVKSVDKQFNVKILDQFEVIGHDRYGTACAIETAREAMGDDNFIAVYGDNLYSVKDILALKIDDDYNYVAGFEHPEPERYGVLIEQDGNLVKLLEKPTKEIAQGHRINTGLYKFTPDIFETIKLVNKSERGEYELTDAITALAKQGKVKVLSICDYWYDLSRPEDIEVVNNFINSQPSSFPPSPSF